MPSDVSTSEHDALDARVERAYYSTMSGRLEYFVAFMSNLYGGGQRYSLLNPESIE